MAVYYGFGSGPYDKGQYDRSWTSDTVTLGVSASELLTGARYSVTVTLAGGFTFTPTGAVSISESFVLKTSLGDSETATILIPETLAFAVSADAIKLADVVINHTVTLATKAIVSIEGSFVLNRTVTLGVGPLDISTSSTGIFKDVWTSVDMSPTETWTSATIGF